MKYLACLLFLLLTNTYTMLKTFIPPKMLFSQQKLIDSTTFSQLFTHHKTKKKKKLLYKYILVDLFTKNPHVNKTKFIYDSSIFNAKDNPSDRFDLLVPAEKFYAAIAHAPWHSAHDNPEEYPIIISKTALLLKTARLYSEKLQTNCLEVYCPQNLTNTPEYPEVYKKFEKLLAQG